MWRQIPQPQPSALLTRSIHLSAEGSLCLLLSLRWWGRYTTLVWFDNWKMWTFFMSLSILCIYFAVIIYLWSFSCYNKVPFYWFIGTLYIVRLLTLVIFVVNSSINKGFKLKYMSTFLCHFFPLFSSLKALIYLSNGHLYFLYPHSICSPFLCTDERFARIFPPSIYTHTHFSQYHPVFSWI